LATVARTGGYLPCGMQPHLADRQGKDVPVLGMIKGDGSTGEICNEFGDINPRLHLHSKTPGGNVHTEFPSCLLHWLLALFVFFSSAVRSHFVVRSSMFFMSVSSCECAVDRADLDRCKRPNLLYSDLEALTIVAPWGVASGQVLELR
jgi:hypothetical protein